MEIRILPWFVLGFRGSWLVWFWQNALHDKYCKPSPKWLYLSTLRQARTLIWTHMWLACNEHVTKSINVCWKASKPRTAGAGATSAHKFVLFVVRIDKKLFGWRELTPNLVPIRSVFKSLYRNKHSDTRLTFGQRLCRPRFTTSSVGNWY
jgi:hypothetical protein